MLAVLVLGCSLGSNGSPQGTGGVTVDGGTSGSAGYAGSTGGQQASAGQSGTTPATAGQTGTTGGQAGSTPASGGQTEATTSSGQAGTPASGGRAGTTTQPASGGQTGAAGQPGTAGTADLGGSAAGSGGSTTATGGRISSGGTTSASGGSTTATGGRISSAGTTSASGGSTTATGGRISSGGITTNSGGVSSGGATSASGGSTGGKPDQGSLPAITVHLAGDSTMANYAATTTQEGWGQEFGQFFISKVTIDNQAQGGANVQSFYSGKWKTLIANVQAGDYVLAAFGINDSGTDHGPVTVPNFTAEFSTMADEVAAKKATFIPTTSSPLQVWVGGKETNDRLQPYCDATIAVGKTKNLLVDDLNARGIEYYNSIGQTAAAALTFNGDKAHFDKAGATEMAQLAAKELTRIGSPLAAYLK